MLSTEYDLADNENDFFEISVKGVLKTKKFQNLDAYPFIFETDYEVFDWACALISESPIGFSLVAEAEKQGWVFQLTTLENGEYYLDGKNKILEVNDHGLDVQALGTSVFFRSTIIYTISKALRDIWHERQWADIENNYNPESIVMLERARAADNDSIAIIIGWDLRSAGYHDTWRHILSEDESDMAQVLVNILERYPTALYNGMVHAHVFRQWYASMDRIDSLDHAILEHLDFLIFEEGRELGTKQSAAKDFENLSTLPDKTVYLKGLGNTVSRDPFFAGLGDPINQAHLFQIVYDNKVIEVDGVPFRDTSLANKIFPTD